MSIVWYLIPFLPFIASSSAQTCSPSDCAISFFDPDLRVSPEKSCYGDSERVTLNCSNHLGGPPFNECANGSWVYPSASCEGFTCPPPNVTSEVIFLPNRDEYDAREIITYKCQIDMGVIGPTTAECDFPGTWNPQTTPICVAYCRDPEIGNGHLLTSPPYFEGHSTQVECIPGSNLEDDKSPMVTCLNTSMWTDIPLCLGQCSFEAVANSDSEVSAVRFHNERKVVNCNVNYSFNREVLFNVTCNNGTIEGTYPSGCFAQCSFQAVANSDSAFSDVRLHDERKVVNCNVNHSFMQKVLFNVTCNDGKIEGLYPTGCFADCSKLTPPVRGMVSGGNLNGQTVSFSCDTGYEINGTATTTTCVNGTWENFTNTPTCFPAPCEPPKPDDTNVIIGPSLKGKYNHQETVTFSCTGEFVLIGTNATVCNYGNWDLLEYPHCGALSCQPPMPVDENVIISPSLKEKYNHQETVTFSCIEGFLLVGTNTTVCTHGNWDPVEYPHCEGLPCRAPNPVDGNIRIGPSLKDTYNHQEIVIFDCAEKFVLIGKNTTVCNHGTWDPPEYPYCEALSCGPPAIPVFDKVLINPPLKDTYNHEETVTFDCPDNFVLVGTQRTDCNYGAWNPSDYPYCEAYVDLIQRISNSSKTITENSTQEEVVAAAEIIDTATTDEDFVRENPETIGLIADSFEAVVTAGKPSVEVTNPVVDSINNLMAYEADAFYNSSSDSARIVAAFEQHISQLQENEGNYTRVLPNVAIKAVQLEREQVGQHLNFANVFQTDGSFTIEDGLQEANTQIFHDEESIPLDRTATSISVPASILEVYNGGGNESQDVRVSFLIFGNAVLFNPSRPLQLNSSSNQSLNFRDVETIASQIISARISGTDISTTNVFEDNIIAKFRINISDINTEWQKCVFWSYDDETAEGYWSDDRCVRGKDENGLIVCSCKRLANFAVLVRLRKDGELPPESLYWITLIGSIISIVCLIVCIASFLLVKKLRSSKATVIHINVCVSLLGFYVAFLSSTGASHKIVQCAVASAAVHYFGLATVTWMTVESVTMYRIFVGWKKGSLNVRRILLASCVFAYGTPLIPVICVSFLDRTILDGKSDYCFLQPGPSLYYGFLAIVGCLFICNLVLFSKMIYELSCRAVLTTQSAKNSKRDEIKRRLRHAFFFWVFFGLSWGSAYFLTIIDNELFEYVYSVATAMQGVMMLAMLLATNPHFRAIFCPWKHATEKANSQQTSRRNHASSTSTTALSGDAKP